MADREKVEQGIKACWSKYFFHSCCDCPYMKNRNEKCEELLGTDTLKLLKEQDDEIKELRSMVEFWKDKALHT